MNKNVSVWRGSTSPPTHHHIWVVDEKTMKLYKEGNWVNMLDNTDIETNLKAYTDQQIINLIQDKLTWL